MDDIRVWLLFSIPIGLESCIDKLCNWSRRSCLTQLKAGMARVALTAHKIPACGNIVEKLISSHDKVRATWPSGYGGSFRRYWETAWVRTPQSSFLNF
jgi:hypothetical protein